VKRLKVRTLFLSDVHLGTADCRIDEVNHLLKYVRCETLVLNGDIIDGWQLRRSGQWTKSHSRFVRLVLKKLEKKDTRIVYLRGNHDDILGRFLPLDFENLSIVEQYIHEGPRGRYLVLHGDVLDAVTMNMVWLAHLGDLGYRLLLRVNRLYNTLRRWRGLEYYSISKAIKARVKSAVSAVSRFEEGIVQLAGQHQCVGVICGHIHTPADKMMGEVHYLNCGDWVESLTAIVEHRDGRFELLTFDALRALFPFPETGEEEEDEVPATGATLPAPMVAG
jgi:UDP-2,3-diacylglucosamine pyrophosphatase LpxH